MGRLLGVAGGMISTVTTPRSRHGQAGSIAALAALLSIITVRGGAADAAEDVETGMESEEEVAERMWFRIAGLDYQKLRMSPELADGLQNAINGVVAEQLKVQLAWVSCELRGAEGSVLVRTTIAVGTAHPFQRAALQARLLYKEQSAPAAVLEAATQTPGLTQAITVGRTLAVEACGLSLARPSCEEAGGARGETVSPEDFFASVLRKQKQLQEQSVVRRTRRFPSDSLATGGQAESVATVKAEPWLSTIAGLAVAAAACSGSLLLLLLLLLTHRHGWFWRRSGGRTLLPVNPV